VSWQTDLLRGLAQYLADAGVVAYAPSAAVATLTKPIVVGDLPDKPDTAVGLRAYSGTADDTTSDVVQPVQFWIRGRLTDVADLSDALFDALHGAVHLTIGGIRVTAARRVSSAPMGRDGAGREQQADNYYLDAHRPNRWRDA
jgi:hypothetical protein